MRSTMPVALRPRHHPDLHLHLLKRGPRLPVAPVQAPLEVAAVALKRTRQADRINPQVGNRQRLERAKLPVPHLRPVRCRPRAFQLPGLLPFPVG